MNELFAMTFGRIFFTLAAAPATTVLAIFAAFMLCIIFQVTILRRANVGAGKPLRARHFVCSYLFVLYMLVVYRLTGMGTLWNVVRSDARICTNSIHLIPLMSFADGAYGFLFFGLNVIMTVPLGFFLAALWPSMRSYKHTALAGFCFSLAIELSQLFTNRGTNVDDLIANTLGAVLGYVLFKLFANFQSSRISNRKLEKIQARDQVRAQSKMLRNEGAIYVVLSFLGMFLFFNSAVLSSLDARLGVPQNSAIRSSELSNLEGRDDDYIKGSVLEVYTDSLVIELIKTGELEDGVLLAASTDSTLQIYFNDETTVDIWRVEGGQRAFLVATGASPSDISEGDTVDIHFADTAPSKEELGPDIPALQIIIWRFS